MRKASSTNSRNRRVLDGHCVVHEALARLALRWKMAVLHAIAQGATTYGALKRAHPSVTDQMLAKRLRDLVSDGLVVKVDGGPRAAAPRYTVTRSGEEALEIAEAICRWATRHQWSASLGAADDTERGLERAQGA